MSAHAQHFDVEMERVCGEVIADRGWMDTEAATACCEVISGGEDFTERCQRAQRVIGDLLNGYTLEQASDRACAGRLPGEGVADVRAAVEVLQTAMRIGQELERRIRNEAELRIDARRYAA